MTIRLFGHKSVDVLNYRKYVIVVINIIISVWLIWVMFFDKSNTDFIGLFFAFMIVFLIIYNVYSLLLYKYFHINKNRNILIEFLFLLFLLLPFLLIIMYLTS
jgi:hypothetical protein